jgi:hypothetical protein
VLTVSSSEGERSGAIYSQVMTKIASMARDELPPDPQLTRSNNNSRTPSKTSTEKNGGNRKRRKERAQVEKSSEI